MKIRNYGVLAGAAFLILCGSAQAKTSACGCHTVAGTVRHGTVHHAAVHRAPAHSARRVSPTRYAQSYSASSSYYDYYEAREVDEGLQSRQAYGQRQEWQSQEESNYRSNDYAYGDSASGPPTPLNGRDFNGGVGYGQYGGMGGYQGGYQGYGRPDPRNGDFDMNGGAMSNAAAARFSVWHGYNSHSGNGY